MSAVATIDDPPGWPTIVAHLSLKLNDKQAILEEQRLPGAWRSSTSGCAGGDRDPQVREDIRTP